MTRHEQQRLADKEHHESRIAWLSAKNPCFACGTPLSRYEALEMLDKSQEALRLINDHGMTTNHAALPS